MHTHSAQILVTESLTSEHSRLAEQILGIAILAFSVTDEGRVDSQSHDEASEFTSVHRDSNQSFFLLIRYLQSFSTRS